MAPGEKQRKRDGWDKCLEINYAAGEFEEMANTIGRMVDILEEHREWMSEMAEAWDDNLLFDFESEICKVADLVDAASSKLTSLSWDMEEYAEESMRKPTKGVYPLSPWDVNSWKEEEE